MAHHAVALDGVTAPQEVARNKVRQACSGRAGWCGDDVVLVADELVGNAAQHTADGPIELLLDVYQSVLAVGVSDGEPDVTAIPVPTLHPPQPLGRDDEDIQLNGFEGVPEDGRGLLLVDLLSTTWSVEKHGNGKIVWAFFALAGAS
ncbi:hypothetical protein CTZ27_29540 [Streptomyces griseocarneus]|nr:hypothetical protein CTZ27_29540 [Streptomyces griseocarneus]